MCIPFLNEMFSCAEPLPQDALVENAANEHYSEGDTGKQQKRITDSTAHIKDHTYHTECESGYDGTILVRMAEYDANIALDEHEYHDNRYKMRMPYSGVVFLRRTSKNLDNMTITIEAEEKSLEYTVETVCLRDYSMEELFEKDLLFLVPFYMFNLEDEFASSEKALLQRDAFHNFLTDDVCERKIGQAGE